ncbi:alpha/beta hydrolase [Thiomicrospira sp. ALE5]|uniref:alpha/beta hydrolase n=1 Tax=Thiomicrospira sp. ALE5 TaxID=748650 RepID=UPI0008E80A0E|nr:alpha/beta hydrolase [Thiomicrospira sp. ALE5]SFR61062.1 Alpha/beta hydrolase family protein [Thiomicrospira sp. ALE5]
MFIRSLQFFVLVIALLMGSKVVAKTVTLESELGFLLQAHYVAAEPDDKTLAVLVLHGFLTNNDFHTVQSLLSGLNDLGVAGLAPNLSYGINARQSSRNCDSLHTHTLEDHRNEINLWIDWLTQQGYQNIILLGHSSGSQYLTYSHATEPHSAVGKLILTSMFYFAGEDIGTRSADLRVARHSLVSGNPIPSKFSLMYCDQDYFATPESYLSYKQLTREQTLSYLKIASVPVSIVMGSGDEILHKIDPGWLEALDNTGAKVITIEGANHFFSSLHEFDLQENIAIIIQSFQDDLSRGVKADD